MLKWWLDHPRRAVLQVMMAPSFFKTRGFLFATLAWMPMALAPFLSLVTATPAAAQNGNSHRLKLDLDALLTLPGLWDTKPQVLEDKFTAEGFQTSPYFAWMGEDKQARTHALFGRQPYKNVSVDVTLFGGRVPVQEAIAEFKDGKLNELRVTIATPEEAITGDLDAYKGVCEAALNKMMSVTPVTRKRVTGAKMLANAQSLTWKGGSSVAALDYSKDARLLEFSLAPPTADVTHLNSRSLKISESGNIDLFVNLDPVISMPGLWDLTPELVEKTFTSTGMKESPYYQWLTTDKSGVRFSRHPFGNVEVDMTLFNGTVPVEEVVIEFDKGKASRVNLSLYNRGDSGEVSREKFEMQYKTAGVNLGKVLNARPTERKPNAQTAVKISGWLWNSPVALAALEYNTDALTKTGSPQFLRMKLAPPGAREAFANESGQTIRKTTLGKSELPKFVKHESGGDVLISGVPMVDQGAKGYCVVASCQRLFGYFQIPVDQHELAQMAASDASRGTSSTAMEDTLKKIDTRFKVNFKPLAYKINAGSLGVPVGNRVTDINQAKFTKMIQDYTGRGVPLLWALELGKYPEVPEISQQSGGGHMRLIIGSNVTNGELIFTDSWGAGHEVKRMRMADAYQATIAVYVIEPKEY